MTTFSVTLAYNLCAYKDITVEAKSYAEAIECLRHNAEERAWEILTPDHDTQFEHRIVSIYVRDAYSGYMGIPLYPGTDEYTAQEDHIIDAEELTARLERLGIPSEPEPEIITPTDMAVTLRDGLDLLDCMKGAKISGDFSNLFVTTPDGQKFFIKVERLEG